MEVDEQTHSSPIVNNDESDTVAENSVDQNSTCESLVSSKSNDNKPSESPISSKSNDKKPGVRTLSEATPETPSNKIAKVTPRATRSSQNPDFAAKQRKFLNRVHHDVVRRDNSSSDNENLQGTPTSSKIAKEAKPRSQDRKRPSEVDEDGSAKKKKVKEPTKVVGGVDSYCWRCHRDGTVIHCDCSPCPRVFHLKCAQLEEPPKHPWMCPECTTVTAAENVDTRSRAMRMLTIDQLCNLLRFAINRMKSHDGAEDFAKPVDPAQFPHYRDFIVKPMDLSQLERNIKARIYGSTEAFLSDARWIVHNSIIFNSVQSKFTNTARALIKICRQEMQEIENCPDCYQNAHTRSSDSWFIEACRRPHILVWAKLKGFPFWPAKAMTTNSENLVDVRFFGAHDRAWVPLSSCFLYSKLSPAPSNNKNKRNLEECLQELEHHIKKLRDKFGQFEYAPYKTPYDPKNEDAQLLMMLPLYDPKVGNKRNSRLSLHHDGARKSLNQKQSLTKNVSPEKSRSEKGTSENSEPEEKTPMVQIGEVYKNDLGSPNKSSPRGAALKNALEERTPKQNVASIPRKRTPLTAAAKKCFATSKKDVETIEPTTRDTVKDTVTIQKKQSTTAENKVPSNDTAVLMRDGGANISSQITSGGNLKSVQNGLIGPETSSTENSAINFLAVDTLPKFIIPKVVEPESGDQMKKLTIADRLQEKLLLVEEALKTHDENIDGGIQSSDQRDKDEETNEELPTSSHETPIVVLHDLRNDKEMLNKMCESDTKKLNKTSDGMEAENQSCSESGSEHDTDASTCGDSDSVVIEEENSKKKKQNNINNVVENLKERKNSIDERIEPKRATDKQSNTLMLDDSVEDVPVLIIDEGDAITSEGKKTIGKSDKSRRKGIPAKVHSRSSTSTESSEASTGNDNLNKTSNSEVLDETSGIFRRSSSSETNVTITLVSGNDATPHKMTGKEIRSVNISKSLSLSVVNTPSLNIEKDSDPDLEVIVDSGTKKVPPRPTARKTLPNSSHSATSSDKNVTAVVQLESLPPPLVSLRPQQPQAFKTYGPSKSQSIPVTAKGNIKPSPRTELGTANAQLEDAVNKLSSQLRTVVEEMLRSASDGGCTEATVRALQIEMERLQWRHRQEIAELKHNTDLMILEIRASMEAEKQRALLDAKHKYEMDIEKAVQETKRKQWCAFCQKEAQLYCCWNTSYCSYNCQQAHWMPHMNSCLNKHQVQGNSIEVMPRTSPQRPPPYPHSGQVGHNN